MLLDGVSRLDSLMLANPSCATGALKRCRATLQGDFGASSFPIPTRKWLTVEASVTDAGTTTLGSDSVEVVLVDRRSTRYGSGWWPAGVTQIVTAGPDAIVVDATGNATIYRGNGANTYVPPPGVFTTLLNFSGGGGWELHPRGTLAKAVFDGSGRRIVSVDQNGNRDSIAYNGATDQVTAFVDPVGKAIVLNYNGSGKLASFTDPGGRQSVVTIASATNQLTYDSLSSPAGRPARATFTYRTYPGTGTVVLLRRVGVIADTTQVVYDSTFRRRPKWVRLPSVPDETGATVVPIVTYTPVERRGVGGFSQLDSLWVEMKDPRNNWTRSMLNRWGQPTLTWDKIGVQRRATYDPDGLPLWSEGKSGDSSRVYQAYDGSRRLFTTYLVRGGGNVLRTDSLVYDLNHRVVKHVDARDKVDSVTYDVKGNVIATRDPAGNVTRTVYRADGLVDSAQARGETKYRKVTYDATWKNPAQVVDENGQVVAQTTVDGWGRDTTTVSRVRVQRTSTTSVWQWRRMRTYYAATNQADSTALQRSVDCLDPCTTAPNWTLGKNANYRRTRYVYDRAGRDSLRITETGKASLTLYDRLGRVVSQRPWTDSLAVKDSLVYDLAGNVVKAITRRGDVITSNYDTRSRDTLTVIPGVGTRRTAYGGPLDQVTRVWYDAPTDSIGGVNAEVRWGYDPRGRLKADTSYTGSLARATTYAYDPYERPSTMTDPVGAWTTRYEAARGIPDTLLTPFADSLLWSTDPRGRSTGTTVRGAGPLQSVSQGWLVTGELTVRNHIVSTGTGYQAGRYERQEVDPDVLGPALGPAWIEQHGLTTAPDTLRDSLTYDGWERLTAWVGTKNGAMVAGASETYTFDAAGNVNPSGTAPSFDATTDRLVQATIGGVARSYLYDRAGNLVQVKEGATVVWAYGYDALDRLVSVRRLGTVIARYGYDVLGRRIAKRVYSSASGGTVAYTRFVYHGDQVAFETDSAGAIGLRYTWDRGTDRLLGVRDAAGTQYYAVTDKLGSVRGLVRRDGTWWLSQRFGPYGAVVARDTTTGGPAVALRYGWTGREYDAETGWYFHRARSYSPTLRRFVQEDPSGDAGGLNCYAYVEGRVMEMVDRGGRRMEAPSDGYGAGSAYGRGEGFVTGEALIAWGEAQWDNFVERSSRTVVTITYSGGSMVTYTVPTNSGLVEALTAHYGKQRDAIRVPNVRIAISPQAETGGQLPQYASGDPWIQLRKGILLLKQIDPHKGEHYHIWQRGTKFGEIIKDGLLQRHGAGPSVPNTVIKILRGAGFLLEGPLQICITCGFVIPTRDDDIADRWLPATESCGGTNLDCNVHDIAPGVVRFGLRAKPREFVDPGRICEQTSTVRSCDRDSTRHNWWNDTLIGPVLMQG